MVPRSLLPLLPGLEQQFEAFEAGITTSTTPDSDPADPDLYVADEDIQVSGTGQIFIDPEAMTRANQAHSRLQNALRNRVTDAGGQLYDASPIANVDLAWRDDRGRLCVAEIKSLTDTNEAHQLRYGLGQLLDYRDEFTARDDPPRCILFIARPPHRITWIRKCDAADIELTWPGRWPRLP